MTRYTGLSLSFCVKDICMGKIAIDQIDKIITGTMAKNQDEWQQILNCYCESYWVDYPEKAIEIANQLKNTGKIYQPRLEGLEPPLIYKGHWILNNLPVWL